MGLLLMAFALLGAIVLLGSGTLVTAWLLRSGDSGPEEERPLPPIPERAYRRACRLVSRHTEEAAIDRLQTDTGLDTATATEIVRVIRESSSTVRVIPDEEDTDDYPTLVETPMVPTARLEEHTLARVRELLRQRRDAEAVRVICAETGAGVREARRILDEMATEDTGGGHGEL